MTLGRTFLVVAGAEPAEENTIDCGSPLAAVGRAGDPTSGRTAYAEARSHVRLYYLGGSPAGTLPPGAITFTVWSRFRGAYRELLQVAAVPAAQTGLVCALPHAGDGVCVTASETCLVTLAVDSPSVDPWEFP